MLKEGCGVSYGSSPIMPTRLVGVTLTPNAPQRLQVLYTRILHLMRKVPPDATYKIYTEAIVTHRLCVVNEAECDIDEIETKINCGSIEMLIRQAQDELSLLQQLIVWKPWEKLVERPPPGQWTWPPH